ncbi:hypothetical protein [Marinomonas atlantica]|uniref:hypothetical protein n=1 Tax=Marinomonas atlantica TaxID=1806668 RepID=UPI000832D06D|nr:hypothetical protein [Marinomonas atlantica]
MAGINPKTNEELAAKLPAIIEAGTSAFKAAIQLGIGIERLRKIASPEQLIAFQKNAEKNLHGRGKLAHLTEEQINQRINEAIKDGLGINQTLDFMGITNRKLHTLASDEQIEQLKENGAARKVRTDGETKAREGLNIIKDPAIAKAKMQHIIATHPAIGRLHV